MKHVIFALSAVLVVLSCTKEQPDTNKQDQASATEIEALRKEVKELREMVEAQVPAGEFEALKQENEALKAQVEKLTATFFEVDGLWFDRNGDVISTPKLEGEMTEQSIYGTLKTSRTYDAKGRVIEVYSEYTDYGLYSSLPYAWMKSQYVYDGKWRKETKQTKGWSPFSGGGELVEEVTETTYW